MSGPARTGLLVYAKHLDRVSSFYERVLRAPVAACGGLALGGVWPAPGLRVRNVCDPEGNILALRELVAAR